MCEPITLCSPDSDKACFACCPPIRPAHYEHIQFRKSIERILRENRSTFNRRTKDIFKKDIIPITGYSCWALGFIDEDHKRVGCLLHPAQNGGNDLRYRIDYNDKCRRETCQEEKVFASLETPDRPFWLQLADGLDSFSYSSRTVNPLFKMMGWGTYLLHGIVIEEDYNAFTWDTFQQAYPFFSTSLRPKAHTYLVNELVRKKGLSILKTEELSFQLEIFIPRILKRLRQEVRVKGNDSFVHQLDLDSVFLDFLRLAGNIIRQSRNSAIHLKSIVDYELGRFYK